MAELCAFGWDKVDWVNAFNNEVHEVKKTFTYLLIALKLGGADPAHDVRPGLVCPPTRIPDFWKESDNPSSFKTRF